MRSLVRAALFSLMVMPAAQAFFPVNPILQVRPDLIVAQVYNPYYEPLFCQGYVYGVTASGLQASAYLGQVIAPGSYRYVRLQANPWINPFVNGWSQIFCRF